MAHKKKAHSKKMKEEHGHKHEAKKEVVGHKDGHKDKMPHSKHHKG